MRIAILEVTLSRIKVTVRSACEPDSRGKTRGRSHDAGPPRTRIDASHVNFIIYAEIGSVVRPRMTRRTSIRVSVSYSVLTTHNAAYVTQGESPLHPDHPTQPLLEASAVRYSGSPSVYRL